MIFEKNPFTTAVSMPKSFHLTPMSPTFEIHQPTLMRDSCGRCVRDVGDIGDVEYLVDVIDLAYLGDVRGEGTVGRYGRCERCRI